VDSLILADGSASNDFPDLSILTSTDADNPKLRLAVLAFDDTSDQSCSFAFRLPANYASGGTLKGIYYMASDVTHKVVWRAAVQAITPDADATVIGTLDAVNAGGGWASANPTVPTTTAGKLGAFSITLTLTGGAAVAAGDLVAVLFQRNPTDTTNDTATGDAVLVGDLDLEYTTT
jgi:hypothetical protein